MTSKLLRGLAASLMLLVSGFWLWFGIASAAAENLGAANWFVHVLVPGALLLGMLALAWRWSYPGGALLALCGLAVCIGYPLLTAERFPLETILFVVALLGLPPLLAGAFFIDAERRARRAREVQP